MKKLSFLFCFLYHISSYAQLQQDLSLPYLAKVPVSAHAIPMVVLLHGYGSNEADLFDLKDVFPAAFAVIAVRAPQAAGNGGYQWYPLQQVQGRREADTKQLAAITGQLCHFIRQLCRKYKIDPERVYVMGFSQGGIMSYQLGLRNPELVRGIGIWSGRLLPESRQQLSTDPALKRLKVFIAHGTSDQVIPFSEAAAARDFLLQQGIVPEYHVYTGMQHQINGQELQDIRKWANSL